jgi:cyclic pyranopterin monophosphate synthase
MASGGLTHIDAHGRARMVDVTGKAPTHRQAIARCVVSTTRAAIASMTGGPENEVLASARVIGIQAAKRTPDLVPLCHPLLIGDVAIDFSVSDHAVEVEARVDCFGQTGVEMEALTACAGAALAICDLCRKLDPLMSVRELRVWEKRGGRSGNWHYQPTA